MTRGRRNDMRMLQTTIITVTISRHICIYINTYIYVHIILSDRPCSRMLRSGLTWRAKKPAAGSSTSTGVISNVSSSELDIVQSKVTLVITKDIFIRFNHLIGAWLLRINLIPGNRRSKSGLYFC